MLGEHPIDVMPTATDLGVVRQFYRDRVGLDVLIDNDEFVTFRCGGDSRLVFTRPAPRAASSRRRRVGAPPTSPPRSPSCARGVEVADYDEPGLRTVDGVADIGFALSAWFVDPGGNTIGLLQFKDEALG